MPRLLTLSVAVLIGACASETPSPPSPEPPAAAPVDDVVTAAPGAVDTVRVLANDPPGLRLTGIGAPPDGGTFGVPADGLERGIVTVAAPDSGEVSVDYYTADAGGTRDSARVVARVE